MLGRGIPNEYRVVDFRGTGLFLPETLIFFES
ncbi:hypothetical protein Lepto7376_3777 [[Leptolyngbya] sp. PCC 7376]|nr:hypothetical protein Lepto7376_3777 [[Leptolyngbya] sp. PCC 7376]